jgi:hypothetical protein
MCSLLVACQEHASGAECAGPLPSINTSGEAGAVVNPGALIANPQKYSGEAIFTTGYIGYLAGDAEEFALFVDKQDLDYGWIAASIALQLSEQEAKTARALVGRRVSVEATFEISEPAVPNQITPFGLLRRISKLQVETARFAIEPGKCSAN